jgi:hypothetical protein
VHVRRRLLSRVWAYLSGTPLAGAILSAFFLVPPHVSTLSHKRHDLRKKVTQHKKSVLISSTTFVSSICHYEKKSARYCHKRGNVFM